MPDHQLSLAIGREGQNARLAARLTGVRVDIRSETQVAEGVPAGGYADDDVEYAEGEWVANAETGEMEWHAADGSVMSQAEWVEQLGGGAAAAEGDAADGDAAVDAEAEATAAERRARPQRTSESRRGERDRRGRWRATVIPMARSERASGAARGVRRPSSSVACSAPTVSARVDRHGAGRGAWLCGAGCFELAVRRRAFDRAWRTTGGC